MANARALITTKNVDTMVKTVPNRTSGRIVTMLSGLMTESVIYLPTYLSKYLPTNVLYSTHFHITTYYYRCNFDGSDCTTNHRNSTRARENAAKWPNCQSPQYINNGDCDTFNDIKDCDFDGNDCVNQKKWPLCPGHLAKLINNGVCEDENNIEECDFDGKDCALKNKYSNCTFFDWIDDVSLIKFPKINQKNDTFFRFHFFSFHRVNVILSITTKNVDTMEKIAKSKTSGLTVPTGT